jgi:hypothetical protein
VRVHPFTLNEHIDTPGGTEIPGGWLPVLAIGAALRALPDTP